MLEHYQIRYILICNTSLLITQLYHFARYVDHVLLQVIGTDIKNSKFKYRISYRHLTFMIETFELLMKSWENLICYSCIFNVQVYIYLNKWLCYGRKTARRACQ